MRSQDLREKNIPDEPGVYFFVGLRPKKEILYIGRATSLKSRLQSYFDDKLIRTRGPLVVDMVTKAEDVEWLRTDSILDAVILEANLIKEHQPRGNTDDKDDKSFNYVVITDEAFPRVLVVRGKELEERIVPSRNMKRSDLQAREEIGSPRKTPHYKLKATYGPYPAGGILKEALRLIRRIFPFRDTCVPHSGKACFNHQLGLCPGMCAGEISKHDYARIITHVRLFFEGRKSVLLKKLEREMHDAAKRLEFERAAELKRTMFALTHIQDHTLIKEEVRTPTEENFSGGSSSGDSVFPFVRIEAYDVAHISGSWNAGVMVVFQDGKVDSSQYRLFRIRLAKGGDDTAGLCEILSRRLTHTEWPYPNVVVVDGGKTQKGAAEKLLAERGFDIAVVAVTKNERHKPERIVGDERLVARYRKEILLLNAEAHRFAIKYHTRLRGRDLHTRR